MSHRDTSFTFALCISLIAHGLALTALAWWIIEKTPQPKLAAINRTQVLVDRMNQTAPRPVEKKQPPTPEKFEKPTEMLKDDSGESQGVGTANRSTIGATPMQANQGYEQANLMKAAEKIAEDAFLPASAGGDVDNNALREKSSSAREVKADSSAAPNSQLNPTKHALASAAANTDPGGLVNALRTQADEPQITAAKDPAMHVPLSSVSTPKPMQKQIIGHRAQASDTESVAFAKSNSVTFRAGEVQGRKGLRVKSKIPRFGLASEVDMQSLGGVHTVIGATVDVDGNVLDAIVLQTSGSSNIDEDCKRAVYDWTLEPQKNNDGQPISRHWTIAFE